MIDPLLTELNVPKPELVSENYDMPDKYHKQLKKIFKKYYHTAIRKLIVLFSLSALAYFIIDDIFNYQPSKATMIIIAACISAITISILAYPLIRIHKIKQKHYKWYIGNVTMSRNNCIYIDWQESIPTNKKDYKTVNTKDIYLIIWMKNRKYAINPHVSDISELAA